MRHTYAVLADISDTSGDGPGARWVPIGGVEAESLSFCQGYVAGTRDTWPPHRAHRIQRSDGKVMEEWKANDAVSVGMVAGFPSPQQYEHAAQIALEKAAQIRESIFDIRRCRPLPPPRSSKAYAAEQSGVSKCRHCNSKIWSYEEERLCDGCQLLFNQGVGVGRAIESRQKEP